MRLPAVGDLVAAVTVALVLVPQSLAYAEIAGLPPVHGLYAAVAAPLAGALIGSSPYLQTGPAPITSLLTFGALVGLATPSTEALAVLAAALAVMVGLVRLFLGLVRGGAVAFLMSQPVVVGFTFAAALLIATSQLPALLGVAPQPGNPVAGAVAAVTSPAGGAAPDIVVGLTTVLVMVAGRGVAPRFPAALVVLVAATAWSVRTGYDGEVVGDIPVGLGPPGLPDPGALGGLLLPALVIAVVGFAEPAAIARRYAAEDRQAWDPDRELLGQGLANVAAGVAGGYPVGGSFSRTALNRLSGARTRWSGALTGLLVLAALPISHLLAPLPQSALAGIVIGAIWGLLDPRTIAAYRRLSPSQFAVAVGTALATLVLAPHVERAVLIGIAAALAVHLWQEVHVTVASERDGPALHLRPSGVLYFGSAAQFEERVEQELAAHPDITSVVVHFEGVGRLDLTGALMLKDVAQGMLARGGRLELHSVRPAHARLLAGVLGPDAHISPA